MTTKPIPDGQDALIPSLVVKDAVKAIEFYKKVFGATEVSRLNYPGGTRVAHAELKIRNSVMMLGDECPEMGVLAPPADGPPPPRSTVLYVTDVDATYNKAMAQGCKPVFPPGDMFWGDRFCKFMDPFGHQWGVATHIRDATPAECEKAMAEWGKK
jgi:PhnB protein